MKVTDKLTITNEDCMELMGRYPDGWFDLAIVSVAIHKYICVCVKVMNCKLAKLVNILFVPTLSLKG